MKVLSIAILLAATLAATPALAQEQGQTEFTLVTTDGGGADNHFSLEGTGEKNPTLVVTPGAEITITLKNENGFHNIQVEGFPASDYVEAAGDEVTYTFTAPESGTLEYFCVPHKSMDMKGTIRVAGTPETTDTETENNNTPGVALLGTLLALGLVAATATRRK